MAQEIESDGFAAERNDREQVANKRRTVRYIRKDIKVTVRKEDWINTIGIGRFRKEVPVELFDISNRGCLIGCAERLAVHGKITVLLTFQTGVRFEIKATVIRRVEGRDQYGIKFAEYNNELGEYMLKTQEKLTFK